MAKPIRLAQDTSEALALGLAAPAHGGFDLTPASLAQPAQKRLSTALLASLLVHGLLWSLSLGGQAFGLPGLHFPWEERRLEARDLRLVLAPAPAAAPAAPPAAVETPPAKPAAAASAPAGERATAPVVRPVTTPPAVRTGKTAALALPAPAPPPPLPATIPEPLPQPAATAGARPEVNLPVAPDAPRVRDASADLARRAPGQAGQETLPGTIDAEAQKQMDRDVRERAAAQARQEQEQERQSADEAARSEAARLDAQQKQKQKQKQEQQEQEQARQERLRQEQARADEMAQQQAARQELERAEAARRDAAQREASRQEQAQLAAQQTALQQEAARQEALSQEAARHEAARQEASRQEAARQEAARQDAARQDALRQEAARREATRQETARQEAARQAALDEEAARQARSGQEQAQREERLRAIGQQMKQEAAQRDAAPTTGSLRRGWLFGRADANADLVEYAQAMGRKIEMNMSFDLVRDVVKQPHTQPVVTVAVRADGSVEKVTFVVSSGVAAIDEAIRKVVASQAPYGRFPPALAAQYDVVEIRRTWVFDMAIRLQ